MTYLHFLSTLACFCFLILRFSSQDEYFWPVGVWMTGLFHTVPDRESMQSEMSVSHDHHHHSLTSRGVGGSEAAVQSERVAVDGRRVEECMKTGVVQAVLALDVPTELVKRAVELRLSCTGQRTDQYMTSQCFVQQCSTTRPDILFGPICR